MDRLFVVWVVKLLKSITFLMRYNPLSKRGHENSYTYSPVFNIVFYLTFRLTDIFLHKYKAIMNKNETPPDTFPIFTRLALTNHVAPLNLKEHHPSDARIERIFLGLLLGHNLSSLHERKDIQAPFHLNLRLRKCFPQGDGKTFNAVITMRPSECVLMDTTDGILRIFNEVKGQRIALCDVKENSETLELTPTPDDTGTFRIYALGNENNLHSPVVSTMFLQIR